MTYLSPRTIALALTLVTRAATAQDAKAPPPPPVNPVSPGTSVDGQGPAPTPRLDPETLQAIRQIVQETIRQQSPQAPLPSQQGYATAPTAYPQAPVTPVMVVRDRSRVHRFLGHIGSKMANMGQPTVTQGFLQQSVSPAVVIATQATTSRVSFPVPWPAAAPAPLATPQAPGK